MHGLLFSFSLKTRWCNASHWNTLHWSLRIRSCCCQQSTHYVFFWPLELRYWSSWLSSFTSLNPPPRYRSNRYWTCLRKCKFFPHKQWMSGPTWWGKCCLWPFVISIWEWWICFLAVHWHPLNKCHLSICIFRGSLRWWRISFQSWQKSGIFGHMVWGCLVLKWFTSKKEFKSWRPKRRPCRSCLLHRRWPSKGKRARLCGRFFPKGLTHFTLAVFRSNV